MWDCKRPRTLRGTTGSTTCGFWLHADGPRPRSPRPEVPDVSKAPLAAAVAGTGFIGPVHVEALRRLGRVVRGVWGSSPPRAWQGAARLGLVPYDSFDALRAAPAVNVVHLGTPNRLHFLQCKQ